MKPEEKIELVERYVAAVSDHDVAAVRALFADDAVLEDPVGSEPHVGIDAVCAFYEKGFGVKFRLELTGPVRCAGDSAAFPFVVTTEVAGSRFRIDVIDVFEFDAAGKVRSMRAYWGPENSSPA